MIFSRKINAEEAWYHFLEKDPRRSMWFLKHILYIKKTQPGKHNRNINF